MPSLSCRLVSQTTGHDTGHPALGSEQVSPSLEEIPEGRSPGEVGCTPRVLQRHRASALGARPLPVLQLAGEAASHVYHGRGSTRGGPSRHTGL